MNKSNEITSEFNVWKYVVVFNITFFIFSAILVYLSVVIPFNYSFMLPLLSILFASYAASTLFKKDFQRPPSIGEKHQFVWMSFITSSSIIVLSASAWVVSHFDDTIALALDIEMVYIGILLAFAFEYMVLHFSFGKTIKTNFMKPSYSAS